MKTLSLSFIIETPAHPPKLDRVCPAGRHNLARAGGKPRHDGRSETLQRQSNMEAGSDDDIFYDCAGGDGRDSPHDLSDEEARSLLRRMKTLERSVQITASALAKSGIDIEGMIEGDEDAKDDEKSRGLIGRWTDKKSLKWKFERYNLPESTFTLLITEPVFSPGFLVGALAAGICVLSLSLVLISEWDNTSPENRFGVPAGVSLEVEIVQFLSIIIGVLMETVRWPSIVFDEETWFV